MPHPRILPFGVNAKHPFDNPIWSALTSRQAHFAEIREHARRFTLEVTSLGGFSEPSPKCYDSLAALQSPGDATGLFLGTQATPPSGWTIVDEAPLLQMVWDGEHVTTPTNGPRPAPGWIELTQQDVPEMVALARITKPGPFGRRTRELGTYIGIRREGKLVAMAGERLRVAGHSEISAVCTLPDYAGQGFAARLMNLLIEKIRNCGEIPFLHVRTTNERAIALYRRLGFADRCLFQYISVCKPAGRILSSS
jgi:ribosomal protein S18 acetylase RimI-like enzyme